MAHLYPSKGKEPEMIDASAMQYDALHQLYKANGTFVNLDSHLNRGVLDLLKGYKLFLRFNPIHIPHGTIRSINEEAIRPVNPKWPPNLSLYPNKPEKGHYQLQDCPPTDNFQKHYDFNFLKILKLESFFSKDASGYLKGSIEEIERPKPTGHEFQTTFSKAFILHFDSNDSTSTKWKNAILKHIDGAINIYVNDNQNNRERASIEDKIKADFRCHLFRAENVPFNILPHIIGTFFRSKYLTDEFIHDQFKDV